MNNRTLFFAVLVLIAVVMLAIGLPLIFMGQTKEAMQAFGGGLVAAMTVVVAYVFVEI